MAICVLGLMSCRSLVSVVGSSPAQGSADASATAASVVKSAEKDIAAVRDTVAEARRETVAKADSVVADTLAAALQRTDSLTTDSLKADTLPQLAAAAGMLKADSIAADSIARDSVFADTVATSSSALDQPVEYTAKDSIVFDMESSTSTLYGDSKVNYTDLEMQAAIITMNLDSSIVHAYGRTDTTGVEAGRPVFKQGSDQYEPDSVSYNFKSRKAFVHNVYTEQGEGFLVSMQSKRDSSGVMYIRRGKYSTCDEAHPHFYLALTRAKIRPGKNVFFGPAYLVLEDVPLPLALPYGFFPFSDSYSSGIIMPTFGDEMSRGFYLREGGYYWAINDKIDLKLMGEIYTKGSWGLSAQSTYKKRYRFSGNVYLSYLRTVEGDKGLPDYSVTKSYKIQWTHRQDPKANPTQTFSASVNFASTSYERNNLTSMYNPESYTQSTRTSSVAYSKTFSRIGLTLSFSGNMSQNVRDSSISLTLPSMNISLQRFYPFKRKKMVGEERWYEKISVSYTGTLSNSISTKEYLLMKSDLVRDWKNGMRHQVPVSASFSILKYINVTPSFNFTDRTYFFKVNREWDPVAAKEKQDTVMGFYNVYNYDLSVSATTKLYGMYTPLIGKKISAIRHVLTPTVSFSYAPDFSQRRFGFYDSYVKTDKNGNVSTVEYSPYSTGMYGSVSQGKTGNVSFDLSNNLEMKVRTERDSSGYKKISLIDELGASLSYNMAAKTKPWSDLSMRVRLKLTKSYTFSMNAVFATYAYQFNENGNVIVGDRTEWSYGRFGRFQGMSQNLSYTFNNDTWKKLIGLFTGKGSSDSDTGSKGNRSDGDMDDDDDDDTTESNIDPDRKKGKHGAKKTESAEVDDDGYLKFSLPWSFTVSYGVTMRENTQAQIRVSRMRYPYKLTHSLNFSGNVRLSEGWDISFSSGYDFNYHQLSMTTASLTRDLHCFSMSASVVLKPYMSYNFTFAAKASALADALKWKKSSSYGTNIEWY